MPEIRTVTTLRAKYDEIVRSIDDYEARGGGTADPKAGRWARKPDGLP
jgi:hypothetical protein